MGYTNLYTPMTEKGLYIFLDKLGERTNINKRLYIFLLRISKSIFLLRDKKERKKRYMDQVECITKEDGKFIFQ